MSRRPRWRCLHPGNRCAVSVFSLRHALEGIEQAYGVWENSGWDRMVSASGPNLSETPGPQSQRSPLVPEHIRVRRQSAPSHAAVPQTAPRLVRR